MMVVKRERECFLVREGLRDVRMFLFRLFLQRTPICDSTSIAINEGVNKRNFILSLLMV